LDVLVENRDYRRVGLTLVVSEPLAELRIASRVGDELSSNSRHRESADCGKLNPPGTSVEVRTV
jgi:hypothetical protein